MSASIAVTGSVAYDHIMNFPGRFKDHILPDKLHILNVSFLVSNLQKLRGGCAANIAHACALLGLDAKLVAAVGNDFGGYRTWLEEVGIDLSGVLEDADLLTASCFITTDGDNNQITGFYPGAMGRAKEATIARLSATPDLAIVSPNDPDAMRAYPEECRQAGIPFIYDPGQQCIALSGEDLRSGAKGSRALVCNDYELALVQEKTGASMEELLELTEAVVVTLGEKGSRIHARGEEPLPVPAAHVENVVDPTGAGDAFRGGLVKGLVSEAGWESAARLGALTAAFCVEQQGTSAYSFTMDEFNARFESAFGLASGLA
ncbi:MAG: carbohydrate kinase family protein [Planctomycetes bacterium]|nr:carbohydrate kinase family protein [Planctomycetota bacterium]